MYFVLFAIKEAVIFVFEFLACKNWFFKDICKMNDMWQLYIKWAKFNVVITIIFFTYFLYCDK